MIIIIFAEAKEEWTGVANSIIGAQEYIAPEVLLNKGHGSLDLGTWDRLQLF